MYLLKKYTIPDAMAVQGCFFIYLEFKGLYDIVFT